MFYLKCNNIKLNGQDSYVSRITSTGVFFTYRRSGALQYKTLYYVKKAAEKLGESYYVVERAPYKASRFRMLQDLVLNNFEYGCMIPVSKANAVGVYSKRTICRIEVRKDEIWLLNSQCDGYHVDSVCEEEALKLIRYLRGIV